MASRNGRTDKQLKQKYEKRTDRLVLVSAIAGLVLCCGINAAVLIITPEQNKVPVPEFVFWILGAAIVPDLIKFVRGERP